METLLATPLFYHFCVTHPDLVCLLLSFLVKMLLFCSCMYIVFVLRIKHYIPFTIITVTRNVWRYWFYLYSSISGFHIGILSWGGGGGNNRRLCDGLSFGGVGSPTPHWKCLNLGLGNSLGGCGLNPSPKYEPCIYTVWSPGWRLLYAFGTTIDDGF